MDHAERETSERDAQAEHVGHQIGLHELRQVEERADDRHGEPDRSGDEQPLLMLPQRWNENVR